MAVGLVGVWLGALEWLLRGMREVKNRVDCNTKATAISTPSSFRFIGLYATPTQTITEVDKEMEEGERTSSEQSFDSMDFGIPCIPSNWLQPSSP